MATENVKVLKIDTSPAQTSVKDLKNELKELKNTMLSCEKGTEEYNQALRQAADIQHTLKEQMQEINATAMDFGQIVSNCTSALGGMVGGFQAATAVMNLFGSENEDVIKTLKTMQQLMSITQALPAIDKGIKAFKALGIAIKGASTALKGLSAAAIATGLGAITFALGLLIANWDRLSEAMKKSKIASTAAEEAIERQRKKIEDLRIEIEKLEKQYDQEEREDKISRLNSRARKSYNDLETRIKNTTKALDLYIKKRQLPENQQGDLFDWFAEEDYIEKQNELIENLKKQQDAILDNADSYKELTESEEEEEKTIEELIAETTEWLELQTKEGETHNAVADAIRKRKQELQELRELEAEDEDTSVEDAFREKLEGTIKSLQDAFGMSESEQYKMELNALDVALKTKLIKEEEYYKLRDALNKEQTQREIMRYSTAAGYIGDIFSNLGELMEEGSEEQKAFQIMGATVNMLGGITAAIAGAFTTHSGPWDIALAVLQAAAIATSGGITIAKMAKTNEKNAKSMSSSGMSGSSMQSLTAPVQYTQDVQGANIESAIKDSKVYVLESDISNTQNKVNVSESESRF